MTPAARQRVVGRGIVPPYHWQRQVIPRPRLYKNCTAMGQEALRSKVGTTVMKIDSPVRMHEAF